MQARSSRAAADGVSNLLWTLLKAFGSDVQAGIFVDSRILWNVFTSGIVSAEGSPEDLGNIFLPPIACIDSATGGPVTDGKPQQNILAETAFSDYARWFTNLLLTPLGVRSDVPSEARSSATGEATRSLSAELVSGEVFGRPVELIVSGGPEANSSSPTPKNGFIFLGVYASSKQKGTDFGLISFSEHSVTYRSMQVTPPHLRTLSSTRLVAGLLST